MTGTTTQETPGGAVTRDAIILSLIVLVALALRLAGLRTAQPVFDESWTLELSAGNGSMHFGLPRNTIIQSPPRLTSLDSGKPWWSVWTSLKSVTHPPLYFVLLRFWRIAFGESDAAARLLSCTASIVGIILFYRVIRLKYGGEAALWAAGIMAVAFPQVTYGWTIRSYSLLVLLGVGACGALASIELRGATKGRIVALGAWILALLLTHYFALGGVLGLAAYSLIKLRGEPLRRVGATFAAVAVIYIVIWGPFMWAQRTTFADPTQTGWLAERGGTTTGAVLWRLATLPDVYLAPDGKLPVPLLGLVSAVLPLVFLRRPRPHNALLWVLWFSGVIGLLLAMDLTRHTRQLAHLKYVLLASPSIYALIVMGVRQQPPIAGRLICGLWIAGCLSFCLPILRGKPDDQGWPSISRYVAGHVPPGQVIVIIEADFDEYLFFSQYARPMRNPVVILDRPPTPQLIEQLRSEGPTWVIDSRSRIAPFIFSGFVPMQQFNAATVGRVEWR